jgi:hypothetical protein
VGEVASGWTPSSRDLPAVRRVCRDLDGLPLALELAAAQCRALSPTDLADALVDRFALLVQERPAAVGHHRTLETAIAWSYDRLSGREQAAFRALAVFVGGFGRDAARRVLGRDADRLLADLTARSLVTVDASGRHGLLESLRAFALARWSRVEQDDVVERHGAWAAELATTAAAELVQGDAAAWLRRLDVELPNLRAAILADLDHDRVARGAATAAALSWFLYRRRHTDVGLQLLQAALAAGPATDDRLRLLNGLCHLQALHGEPEAALTTARVAAEEAGRSGSSVLLADACSTLGWMLALSGDAPGARSNADRARRHAAASADPVTMANSALAAALVAYLVADVDDVAALLWESGALAARARHPWCASQTAWLVAKSSLRAGRAQLAVREAAAVARQAHLQEDVVLTLAGALVVAVAGAQLGRVEDAARLLGAVLSRVQDRLEHIDPLDGPGYGAEVVGLVEPGSLAPLLREGAGWDDETLLDRVQHLADSVPPSLVARAR